MAIQVPTYDFNGAQVKVNLRTVAGLRQLFRVEFITQAGSVVSMDGQKFTGRVNTSPVTEFECLGNEEGVDIVWGRMPEGRYSYEVCCGSQVVFYGDMIVQGRMLPPLEGEGDVSVNDSLVMSVEADSEGRIAFECSEVGLMTLLERQAMFYMGESKELRDEVAQLHKAVENKVVAAESDIAQMLTQANEAQTNAQQSATLASEFAEQVETTHGLVEELATQVSSDAEVASRAKVSAENTLASVGGYAQRAEQAKTKAEQAKASAEQEAYNAYSHGSAARVSAELSLSKAAEASASAEVAEGKAEEAKESAEIAEAKLEEFKTYAYDKSTSDGKYAHRKEVNYFDKTNTFRSPTYLEGGVYVLPLGTKTSLGADAFGLSVSADGGLQLWGTHFMKGSLWGENGLKMVQNEVSLTSTDSAAIGFDYANNVVFRTMPNDGDGNGVYEFECYKWTDDSHTTKEKGYVDVRKKAAMSPTDDSLLNRSENDSRYGQLANENNWKQNQILENRLVFSKTSGGQKYGNYIWLDSDGAFRFLLNKGTSTVSGFVLNSVIIANKGLSVQNNSLFSGNVFCIGEVTFTSTAFFNGNVVVNDCLTFVQGAARIEETDESGGCLKIESPSVIKISGSNGVYLDGGQMLHIMSDAWMNKSLSSTSFTLGRINGDKIESIFGYEKSGGGVYFIDSSSGFNIKLQRGSLDTPLTGDDVLTRNESDGRYIEKCGVDQTVISFVNFENGIWAQSLSVSDIALTRGTVYDGQVNALVVGGAIKTSCIVQCCHLETGGNIWSKISENSGEGGANFSFTGLQFVMTHKLSLPGLVINGKTIDELVEEKVNAILTEKGLI